jgi:Fe-S-cluster-containing hydrogenase component 2
MSYVIAEPCVDHMDQSCVAVCPVDAISAEPGVDRKMFIDPDTCIECGSCQSVCPNGAIYQQSQLPADFADYAWLDAAWFRDRAVARSVLLEVVAAGQEVAA